MNTHTLISAVIQMLLFTHTHTHTLWVVLKHISSSRGFNFWSYVYVIFFFLFSLHSYCIYLVVFKDMVLHVFLENNIRVSVPAVRIQKLICLTLINLD